jgi:hypothetical protein
MFVSIPFDHLLKASLCAVEAFGRSNDGHLKSVGRAEPLHGVRHPG